MVAAGPGRCRRRGSKGIGRATGPCWLIAHSGLLPGLALQRHRRNELRNVHVRTLIGRCPDPVCRINCAECPARKLTGLSASGELRQYLDDGRRRRSARSAATWRPAGARRPGRRTWRAPSAAACRRRAARRSPPGPRRASGFHRFLGHARRLSLAAAQYWMVTLAISRYPLLSGTRAPLPPGPCLFIQTGKRRRPHKQVEVSSGERPAADHRRARAVRRRCCPPWGCCCTRSACCLRTPPPWWRPRPPTRCWWTPGVISRTRRACAGCCTRRGWSARCSRS